jgi:hypothetical protein
MEMLLAYFELALVIAIVGTLGTILKILEKR